MPPEIIPLLEEPALIVTNSNISLVVADIHLGIEWDLLQERNQFAQPNGRTAGKNSRLYPGKFS